jgi:prepilin-type N-terminal cleavage/methylation domain-containing protein
MKTNKCSGFTLVEMMIIAVIIGLLAAMAIPAVQKVKFDTIESKVTKGQYVSPQEYRFYRESRYFKPLPVVENKTINYSGEIVINGKTYLLVEKN